MKYLLPFIFSLALLSCQRSPESARAVLLPKFQVDGKEENTPNEILQPTVFQLMLSKPVYDQVSQGLALPPFEKWQQTLRISPVRNTNLIEISIQGPDPKKAQAELQALLRALREVPHESFLNGKKGRLELVILEDSTSTGTGRP